MIRQLARSADLMELFTLPIPITECEMTGQVIVSEKNGMVVTVQVLDPGTLHARWIVRFFERGIMGRVKLDRTAHWTAWSVKKNSTDYRQWDSSRWNPIDSNRVSDSVLKKVELWLKKNPASSIQV